MLSPAKPDVSLNLLDEYPRWLKKEHEITGEIGKAVPISAIFELSNDELKAFSERFGSEVLTSPEVTFTRTYTQDHLQVDVELDHPAFVKPFLASLPNRLQKSLANERISTASQLIEALSRFTPDGDDPDAATLASDAGDASARLAQILNNHSSLTAAVAAHMGSILPRTFYFSTYSQLAGRYRLEDVFDAVHNGSDDEELRAAADFLKLARVVPENIEDWDFEQSNAELEAVSSLLTRRVKEHWRQNDHLKLKVELESQQVTEPPNHRIQRYLQFRVEDTRHDFSSRLDRRSTGFRWFISFIASFLEFEADANLILLLDEPGLSLHARAQLDLLDTIESRLAANRQVLYSTHSPFMVKPNRLAGVRIAEDKGPDIGSIVTNDAGTISDPDTLFPLQAALGYDIAQNLFVGNRNILVEGISDFIYLSAVSDYLESKGRTCLPADARLLPAGGATNIPTFIALLGGALDVVVLLDGSSDLQRVEDAIAKSRLDKARVLSLDSFTKIGKADIEDLFTPAEYLKFYNGAFSEAVKVSDLKGTDRIVKRIARFEGHPFNHGVVAAHFLRSVNRSVSGLSTGTIDRFEEVIKALVKALPAP